MSGVVRKEITIALVADAAKTRANVPQPLHLPLVVEAGEAVVLGASIPRGRLRVSAPVVLAHVAFPRIGARFALAYPEVQLEIVAEDRMVDLVEDGYDLVIRINPSPDERLVGRGRETSMTFPVRHGI